MGFSIVSPCIGSPVFIPSIVAFSSFTSFSYFISKDFGVVPNSEYAWYLPGTFVWGLAFIYSLGFLPAKAVPPPSP